MTHLEIFNRMMTRAKAGGYKGPDYKYQTGQILDGTNIYSLIFRDDFSKAVWGENDINVVMHGVHETMSSYLYHLTKMIQSKDKWKYLEENAI